MPFCLRSSFSFALVYPKIFPFFTAHYPVLVLLLWLSSPNTYQKTEIRSVSVIIITITLFSRRQKPAVIVHTATTEEERKKERKTVSGEREKRSLDLGDRRPRIRFFGHSGASFQFRSGREFRAKERERLAEVGGCEKEGEVREVHEPADNCNTLHKWAFRYYFHSRPASVNAQETDHVPPAFCRMERRFWFLG